MSKIVIVAETGSDISPELAARYGIYLVPMHVMFGDVEKDDGSFSTQEILDYYQKTGKTTSTSGCNVEDFVKVYDQVHREHPDSQILHLAYSAQTTVSYESSKIAAQDRDYVTIFDTKQVSVGQCAAVIRSAQLLKEHPDWDAAQALPEIEDICRRTHMGFTPTNLDFLRAGGRVNNAAALMGNILHIIPMIDIKDGRLIADRKYRGCLEKVLPKFISDYTKTYNLDRSVLWASHTVGFDPALKELVEKTAADLGFRKVNWGFCLGVITSHGGPNAFTIAGFSRKQ